MPLETGTYISDLNSSNPAATDEVSKADDHLRWIKSALLATFTAITGAVTATHTQLNRLASLAGLSVLGVTGSASAAPDAITAGTDGYVLRRSGTTLAFGQVATAGIEDDAVTAAKVADGAIDATAKIANDVVTYAKMQNVSATDRLLGRSTSGAGDVEEITCTSAGRALLDDANAAAQRTTLSAAGLTQTDFLSVLIPAPEDKTYRIVTKLPYAITITEVVSDCATGTCTATIKNDGVAIDGTANSVSTTEQSQSHAEAVSAGADIDVTISSNSAAEDVSLMIKFTRTLDD